MAGVDFRGDDTTVPLLRTLFDRVPLGVAFYDRDLRYITVNEAFAAMSGCAADAHAGRTLHEILPAQAAQIEPHVRAVFEQGVPAGPVTLTGMRGPGRPRSGHWQARYQPVADGATVIAVMALVSDVEAQRRSDAILLTQRDVLERCVLGEPLATVLDRVTGAVEEHATDGALASVLLVEHGRLHHCSAPRLPAAYMAAIDGQPIGPEAGSCGTAAFRGEAVFVRDIETDPLWRNYRPLALAHGLRACWSVPIVGSDGGVLGTFALYYREPRDPEPDDIGLIRLMARTSALLIEWWRGEEARRRLLDREREARRAAEEDNRGKDEFVATLSHELRTPLNAIMGWTRLLQIGNVDAVTTRRAIAAIERNADVQSRLVEDLLDIARIARGGLRLDVSAVDLHAVALGALDAVKPMADAKGVRLVSNVGEGPAPIEADPTRLRQVIWNLLSNAVKFTPSGGEVRLELRREDGSARVVVSDTGIGIPPEILPHIFERYRQGDATGGGLGLGLAIASSVVSLHGGALRAASDGPGCGSRFDFLLPCAAPALGAHAT